MGLWNRYYEGLASLQNSSVLRLPSVPKGCSHNAHMFYILMPTPKKRSALLGWLASNGVQAVSHYVPLHSSPAGRRFGRVSGGMSVTNRVAACLLRLPLYAGLSQVSQRKVIALMYRFSLSGGGQ